MNRLQKYVFNGLLLSLVSILIRSISVSFNIYVSSKVGAEGMGLLNLTASVYGFAITLATSGINLAVVRLVSGALPYGNEAYFDNRADKRVHKIMRNALFYCLFFSLLSSVLLFSFADTIGTGALGDRRTVPSLRLLAFTLTPISLSAALNGYFSAVRRIYKSVIVQICEQGVKITVVSALLIAIAPKGLEYACVAVVAGGAISEAVCVFISATLYFFDRKIHKNEKFKIVKSARGLENTDTGSRFSQKPPLKRGLFEIRKVSASLSSKNATATQAEEKSCSIISVALPVAISTYVRSALITVEHLAIPWGLKKSGASATDALSSYGILHGMVFPVLLFPSAVLGAFSSLLIPELSGALEQADTKRIRHIASRVIYFSLLFSIGVSGIFVCFSNQLGTLLYNSSEAGELIRLLAPLIPLMYLDSSVDAMLKGLGEQLYTMRVNIADAFISVVLVISLLPSMGIYGYVLVIFLMELFNTSLSIIKLLKITKIKTPVFKWVIKPLFCVIASTALTRLFFDFSHLSPFISASLSQRALCVAEIAFCASIYLLLSRILGAISKDDVSFARAIIKP